MHNLYFHTRHTEHTWSSLKYSVALLFIDLLLNYATNQRKSEFMKKFDIFSTSCIGALLKILFIPCTCSSCAILVISLVSFEHWRRNQRKFEHLLRTCTLFLPLLVLECHACQSVSFFRTEKNQMSIYFNSLFRALVCFAYMLSCENSKWLLLFILVAFVE